MGNLFQRAIKLQVDSSDITGLDCVFKVKRNLKPEPNTLDLRVYNLTENHRTILQKRKTPVVKLEAGYGEDLALLYLGEAREVHNFKEGPDFVTEIGSGDGDKALATRRINLPVAAKTGTADALRSIVDALGIGKGNTDFFATKIGQKVVTLFPKGTVLSGNASRELTDLCRSVGAEWSVQNGAVQLLQIGEPLAGKAVELGPDSGLVGSPTIDNKDAKKGSIVKATCLLIPDLVPGRKVTFKSVARLEGGFRIEEVTYRGDTSGRDWYAEIECKRY